MHDEVLSCVYCGVLITDDDDAQRVSKRDVAHSTCAFAVDGTFFAALDAQHERSAT